MKLLRKLLKRSALPPHVIVTDKLRSYAAALRQLGFTGRHDRVFVSWQQNIALFVSLI
jgi:transposase-like protein